MDKKLNVQTIWELVKTHKKQYIIVCSIVFALSAIKVFTTPNYYSSTVSLAPESSTGFSGGGLGSLASLAGINLSGLGGNDADAIVPEIYPEVVSSTPFLQTLLKIQVVDKEGTFKGTLSEYLTRKKPLIDFSEIFGEKADTTPKGAQFISPKQMKIIEKLKKDISVQIEKKTGMISMAATFEDPYVAQIVADSLSSLLQKYIFNYRTHKAANDLKFATQFMEQSKKEYLQISQKYASFADSHTNLFMQEYKTQETFLENEMSTKYQIYTQAVQQVTLAQSKLQSKIPVYHIIQPAIVPTKKAGPKRMIMIFAFELLALIGTTCFFYLKERS